MKKFLVTGFYFALTAAICAAGFWFPSALSKYQDEQIYAKIERPAVEPMTLTYSSSLHDTLQLLSNNYYSVEYPYASSIHTESEVHKIVSRLLKKFGKYGLLTENLLSGSGNAIQGQSATLSLAIACDGAPSGQSHASSISNSSSTTNDVLPVTDSTVESRIADYTTAVIWNCSIYFQDSSMLIMSIDDKSGKLVGYNIYNAQVSAYMDEKELSKYADAVAKFLKNHYGMKAHATLSELNEAPVQKIYDEKAFYIESTHSIKLTEESGDTIQLKLINSTHEINFN